MSSTALAVPAAAMDGMSVTRQPAPKTNVPVLDHALKARALQSNRTMRATGSAVATAQLFALGMDGTEWEELFQLHTAAWARLRALQEGWAEDWKNWWRYAEQLKGANTMAKLAERECNISAQLVSLLGAQATSLVGLQENIEVDYFYWVQQRLDAKRRELPKFDFAR